MLDPTVILAPSEATPMSYLSEHVEKYRQVEHELAAIQKTRRLTDTEFFRLNRAIDIQLAARLGLELARYSGGNVEGTGDFCRTRNAKVFTVDEILSWKDAPDRPLMDDYDPFLDLGGNCCHPDQEHCQHRLMYIPNEMSAL